MNNFELNDLQNKSSILIIGAAYSGKTTVMRYIVEGILPQVDEVKHLSNLEQRAEIIGSIGSGRRLLLIEDSYNLEDDPEIIDLFVNSRHNNTIIVAAMQMSLSKLKHNADLIIYTSKIPDLKDQRLLQYMNVVFLDKNKLVYLPEKDLFKIMPDLLS